MNKPVPNCPVCHAPLQISVLTCPDCGLELKGSFAISPFDRLDDAQRDFLLCFLRNKGNLKEVQEELGVSYPTAKKALDALLICLDLADREAPAEWEVPSMDTVITNPASCKASEIIKDKLKNCGGRARLRTARGLPCEIAFSEDGNHLVSSKLPGSPLYEFTVFDVIVDLLLKNGGKARKGNGRSFKLGEPGCDESTVVGYIGKHYSGHRPGDSVFDPVFVFAAILEWADIAHNGRGELTLTASYRERLQEQK